MKTGIKVEVEILTVWDMQRIFSENKEDSEHFIMKIKIESKKIIISELMLNVKTR